MLTVPNRPEGAPIAALRRSFRDLMLGIIDDRLAKADAQRVSSDGFARSYRPRSSVRSSGTIGETAQGMRPMGSGFFSYWSLTRPS